MKHFSVKVCGITRPQDAEFAAELGVDMLGMIFHSRSPRYITISKAKQISRSVPPTVDKVGVFVNHTVSQMLGIAEALSLQYVQIHRMLTKPEVVLLQNNHLKVIQACFVANKTEAAKLKRVSADIICLDNQSGGTGKQFDWSISLPKRLPNLMLAGGINMENVAEGVRKYSPLIVDVNSGVEVSPGVKSQNRLRLFMKECNRLRYGK